MNRFGYIILLLYIMQFASSFLFRNYEIDIPQLFLIFMAVAYMLLLSIKRAIKFPIYLRFYLAYILYVTFSYTTTRDYSYIQTIRFVLGRPFYFSFFMLLFIENIDLDNMEFEVVKKFIAGIVYFSSIVLIFQVVFPEQFVRFYDANIGFAGEYVFGQRHFIKTPFSWMGSNVGVITLVSFYVLYADEMIQESKHRFAQYLVAIIVILYTILIQARYLILLSSVSIVILFFLNVKHFLVVWRAVLVMGITFVVIIQILSVIGFDATYFYQNRILSETSRSRTGSFYFFANEFPNNPVLGTGGQISNELERQLVGFSSQIHVGYLSLFYYYGVIGGLLFLCVYIFLVKDLYQQDNKSRHWGSFAFIIAYLVSVETTLVLLHLGAQGIAIAKLMSNNNKTKLDRSKQHYGYGINADK